MPIWPGIGDVKGREGLQSISADRASQAIRAVHPRSEVRDYCKIYPSVRHEEMLAEAIKIAVAFEPKFDPNLGDDFSTPLRWHLRGLHRFAQNEFNGWQIPVPKAKRDANELERLTQNWNRR